MEPDGYAQAVHRQVVQIIDCEVFPFVIENGFCCHHVGDGYGVVIDIQRAVHHFISLSSDYVELTQAIANI